MQRRISTLLLASLSATATAQLVVPTTQYPTIQSAIDAATPSQTIIVRPGTYTENISFKGKDITVQGIGGPSTTTIDGNQAGPCVVFDVGSTRAAVLEGFTIRNGVARRPGTLTVEVGGGILVHGCSPTIRRCIVRNNRSNQYGGGIGGTDWVSASMNVVTAPLIEDCIVEQNTASGVSFASGAGIAITGFNTLAPISTTLVRNCTIRDNTATTRGAGAYFGYNQHATIEGCTFTRNTTLGTSGGLDGGTAIWMFGGSVCLVRNNRIFGNTSASNGAGIKFFNVTGVQIVNNTIVNNTGGSVAGFANAGSFGINVSANVVNSILHSNGPTEIAFSGLDQNSQPPSATVSYSNVAGGYAGTGNFPTNPLLANGPTGNHRLLPGSPCINTGDNAAANAPSTDFENDPRPIATIDVGADEFNPAAAFLYAATSTIPVASPGTTNFTILGGTTRANHLFVLLPSLSGTQPGLTVGSLHLPLNVDRSTTILLSLFAPTFVGFLNPAGTASPTLPLGTTPIPEMLNAEISFAAAIITQASTLNAFTNDETLRFQ